MTTMDELEAAKAAVERALAIHYPVEAVNYYGLSPERVRVCAGCGTDDGNWVRYPCPTVRALEIPVVATTRR